MTLITQKEYAQLRGCSPAYVSKLKRQGRLVLSGPGLVDVGATDALVRATRKPRIHDAPHAADEAAHESPLGAAHGCGTSIPTADESDRRERYANAQLAELRLALAAGSALGREDVFRIFFKLTQGALDELLKLSFSNTTARQIGSFGHGE